MARRIRYPRVKSIDVYNVYFRRHGPPKFMNNTWPDDIKIPSKQRHDGTQAVFLTNADTPSTFLGIDP